MAHLLFTLGWDSGAAGAAAEGIAEKRMEKVREVCFLMWRNENQREQGEPVAAMRPVLHSAHFQSLPEVNRPNREPQQWFKLNAFSSSSLLKSRSTFMWL